MTYDVLESKNYFLHRKFLGNKKMSWYKSRRTVQPFLLASAEDGVAVNGSRASDDVEEMRAKLTGSLQDEYNCDGLIQSMHDAARTFELALKEKISSSKLPWFSAAWLGVDRNAWVKTFSYQVCISLVQCIRVVTVFESYLLVIIRARYISGEEQKYSLLTAHFACTKYFLPYL